mmetsp:Transcript_32038/g.47324  ORF Transcript_32038/g.47324 Transcript_32038/m.47324 type:complete len:160 (+) Transcript_32038:116-595(+)
MMKPTFCTNDQMQMANNSSSSWLEEAQEERYNILRETCLLHCVDDSIILQQGRHTKSRRKDKKNHNICNDLENMTIACKNNDNSCDKELNNHADEKLGDDSYSLSQVADQTTTATETTTTTTTTICCAKTESLDPSSRLIVSSGSSSGILWRSIGSAAA